MRIDALKQYAKLHQQLLEEKRQLEERLRGINEVLGVAESFPSVESKTDIKPATGARRGRRSRNALSMREAILQALSNGPLARKEIVSAVQDLGYVFKTNNPLNSIGAILYGKNTPVKNKDGKFYIDSTVAATVRANSGLSQNGAGQKKKRVLSPEAREKIAAAQRARWAKQRRSK